MWSDPLSTVTSTYLPRGSHQPGGAALVRSLRHGPAPPCRFRRRFHEPPLGNPGRRLQTAQSAGSRVLATTVAFVAAILASSRAPTMTYLHCGSKYIRCGETYVPNGPGGQRSSRTTASTQPGPEDFMGAYLRTRVLRCRCGLPNGNSALAVSRPVPARQPATALLVYPVDSHNGSPLLVHWRSVPPPTTRTSATDGTCAQACADVFPIELYVAEHLAQNRASSSGRRS